MCVWNELFLKEALVGLWLSTPPLERRNYLFFCSKPSEGRSGFQEDLPDIVTLKFASCVWGLMTGLTLWKTGSQLWGGALPLSQEIGKVKRKGYLFGRKTKQCPELR